MATKDSQELKSDERYPLGEYSFRIERSAGTSPNYDKIEAICTKDSKNARKSIQVPSITKLDGWYVEANDETADVYIVIQTLEGGSSYSSSLDTSPVEQPIPTDNSLTVVRTFQAASDNHHHRYTTIIQADVVTGHFVNPGTFQYIVASDQSGKYATTIIDEDLDAGTTTQRTGEYSLVDSYTHDNKTVYYEGNIDVFATATIESISVEAGNDLLASNTEQKNIAWTVVYGKASGGEYGDPKDMLVGRFAIELKDAGGVGPGGGTGGGWTDPGDYDEDWEEGDPTHTLYVNVTGALSGRHNDPIEDQSYSYIPADKDTVKDYGCGGDGGHGGGGGAGASTVVIHKFATNQANSKEVTAIARRHGYGSGGGKGGKGGDGCILVYY